MKRILLLSILLLVSTAAFGQSRTNRLTRPCPATTTSASVAITSSGDISISPCSGKSITQGTTTVNGVKSAAGTAAAPSISFSADSDTGLYSANTDTIGFSTGGTVRLTLSSVGTLSGTGGVLSSSPTIGVGYTTGAGGAVTQETSKSTTVVSDTITTAITLNAAALNAATIVGFTFTNATIAATDTVLCTHQSAGTSAAYTCNAFPGAGSAVISVRNNTAGNLSEAIVLRVTVIKSVSN